jgi:hypothetical protein
MNEQNLKSLTTKKTFDHLLQGQAEVHYFFVRKMVESGRGGKEHVKELSYRRWLRVSILVWVLSSASDKSTGEEEMQRLKNTKELVLFDFNSNVFVTAGGP